MSATAHTTYPAPYLHARQQERYARIAGMTAEIDAVTTAAASAPTTSTLAAALGAARARLEQLRRWEIWYAHPAHRDYPPEAVPADLTARVAEAAALPEREVTAVWDGPVPRPVTGPDLTPPPSKPAPDASRRRPTPAEVEEVEEEQTAHLRYLAELVDWRQQTRAADMAARQQLHAAARAAYPENRGWRRLHGAGAQIAAVTGLSLPAMRQIRDGEDTTT